MLLFLLVNFVTAFKMFTISVPNAILTSFTSVLTPSIYPSDNPVRTIAFIAKFHIFNSIITTVFIALCALVQFFTAAKLDKAWNSLDRSEAFNSILGNSSGIWEGNVHGDDTWEGNITGNNCVNSTSPVECNRPHQLELPLLLQAGILPPIIVAGVVYLVIVTLTMGIIRPGFLELPAAPQSSAAIEDTPEVSKLLK